MGWKKVVLPEHYEEFAEKIEDLRAFNWHKNISQRVRAHDRKRRANHSTTLAVFIFDFKMSVYTNESNWETSDEVRNRGQVSYFNCTIEYRNEGDAEMQRIYFDVVSDTSDHSAYATKGMLQFLMKDPRVLNIIKNKTEFEAKFDCCPDNLNCYMAHEILVQWPKVFPDTVQFSWAPYVNRMGKCISDIRFGAVDTALKNWKMNNGIYSSADVVKAVKTHQEKTAESRKTRYKKNPLKPIKVIIEKHNLRKVKSHKFGTLTIPKVQSTFCVSYFRDTDEMINNRFPDVEDRRQGVKLDFKKLIGSEMKRKVLGNRYAKREKDDYKRPAKIVRQMKANDEWDKLEKQQNNQ